MDIITGIVLFNPDIEQLKRNLTENLKYSNKIILINNNSNNSSLINKEFQNERIIILNNDKNLGIASALNQIYDFVLKNNFKYLLTLDQDSFFSEENFKKLMIHSNEKDCAILCPKIIDLNKRTNGEHEVGIKEVERCITSGSLMIMEKCKEIGRFDEKMFIDYVDFDYCKRIRLNKYKIIRVYDSIIEHEIGKRSQKKFLFWNVYPTNHNSFRVYYYSRNICYYLKKFKGKMSFKEKNREYIYLIWKEISIILYEQHKLDKTKAFFKGIKDSKEMMK